MGEEKGELSDEAMRAMLAEAMKMWAAEGVPADLDLTAWLDALANPPPDPEPSHGQRGGRSHRSR